MIFCCLRLLNRILIALLEQKVDLFELCCLGKRYQYKATSSVWCCCTAVEAFWQKFQLFHWDVKWALLFSKSLVFVSRADIPNSYSPFVQFVISCSALWFCCWVQFCFLFALKLIVLCLVGLVLAKHFSGLVVLHFSLACLFWAHFVVWRR